MRPTLIVVILLLGISVSCTRRNDRPAIPNTSGTEAAQPRNSVDVVKASAAPAEIKRKGTADVMVQLSIERGYHVNANPPTFPYLKATELEVARTPGISVSYVVYPDAITKSFAFADKPLAVYEGTISIKANLSADSSLPPGNLSLAAKLRVQACDEQVCYAPGTLDVSIPLNIK